MSNGNARLGSTEYVVPTPLGSVVSLFGTLLSLPFLFVGVHTAFITSTAIACVLVGVAGVCRIVLGGYTRKYPVPPLSEIYAKYHIRQPSKTRVRTSTTAPLIVVTGGTGFLGWTIVKQLVESSHTKEFCTRVVVVDICPPRTSRTVPDVAYHVADLAVDDLSKVFEGADAVIHTAGLVDLTSDVAVTHNAHVVATARVIAATRREGVRALVVTSSVGAVSTTHNLLMRSQLSFPCDYIPQEHLTPTSTTLTSNTNTSATITKMDPNVVAGNENSHRFPFFCSYSSTKFRAERLALAADGVGVGIGVSDIDVAEPATVVDKNYDVDKNHDADGGDAVDVNGSADVDVGFCVCALRMPMIFGLEDPMVVAPMLRGELTRIIDTRDTYADFVYVDNAAAAHVRAMKALLMVCPEDDGVAAKQRLRAVRGKAFNVTNGDDPMLVSDLWRQLAAKAHLPPLESLPPITMMLIAMVSEAVFALLAGHVPCRRHPFWNLTPHSLNLANTSVSQDVSTTHTVLGFHPKYTTLQAFDHMLDVRKKQHQQKQE